MIAHLKSTSVEAVAVASAYHMFMKEKLKSTSVEAVPVASAYHVFMKENLAGSLIGTEKKLYLSLLVTVSDSPSS